MYQWYDYQTDLRKDYLTLNARMHVYALKYHIQCDSETGGLKIRIHS
jgi:hypothetical protein